MLVEMDGGMSRVTPGLERAREDARREKARAMRKRAARKAKASCDNQGLRNAYVTGDKNALGLPGLEGNV